MCYTLTGSQDPSEISGTFLDQGVLRSLRLSGLGGHACFGVQKVRAWRFRFGGMDFPDPRKDLESRSPYLGPCSTKGTFSEPPLRDLLFGSSRGSGFRGLGVQKFGSFGLSACRLN